MYAQQYSSQNSSEISVKTDHNLFCEKYNSMKHQNTWEIMSV